MLDDLLEYVKKQRDEWLENFHPVLVYSWIICCFIAISYLLIYIILKIICVIKNFICGPSSSDDAEMLADFVQSSNVFESIKIIEANPHLINKPINEDGLTPFMLACANSNTQLVKFMIERGADVNKTTQNCETGFYLAVFHHIRNPGDKNASCIRELYYAGANINAPNGKNYTPIQMASIFGHTPLVKWLLAKGATISSPIHPYFLASSQGYQETANVILEWEKTRILTIGYS